ncbi:hypothetical protein BDV98DRAFT_567041 [Pterulicium gracile]|uniref:Rho guanine nucleotide exchange factor scd1 n=1 Tax=Pterulicium gracile TaxID=1884261 RepID=A0A5C3QHM9_9AGAR|nr:hypothetical protein BDV98DRAFT_567041 [Pterula gracilis]
MASSNAARKKSIISAIDIPVASNSVLNTTASQSNSLYHQCSALRSRLLRVKGFAPFFSLASHSTDSRQSTDPVTLLWDLFSLGFPLVYVYNLLPPPLPKIEEDWTLETFDITNERAKKRGIALFAMQMANVPGCERFTVTDLWDHQSTDGLVKVITNVARIVDRLGPDAFEEEPSSPQITSQHDSAESLVTASSSSTLPVDGRETTRRRLLQELVDTERKYVQDLEVMQKYSTALSRTNAVDQDTIHYLFPNLNKLLNFQRKFLIRMEAIAEQPLPDQRWGSIFLACEPDFVVYEPYCANYNRATDLMMANEHLLMEVSHTINLTPMKGELPAFLIKPIQRVCRYPLLFESLVKTTADSEEDRPLRADLEEGLSCVLRIADKINEAKRRSENDQMVSLLHSRVEDWKGHHLSNFGDLILDELFSVTKSDVDREYHVFLFEKIILCCKESPTQSNSKKVSKSNSILKKQSTSLQSPVLGALQSSSKKATPLLLKGRIFLNNVTQALPGPPVGNPPLYPLAVWWRGDDDLEFFTLRCRTLDTMRQWESHINRLIKEASLRRGPDRSNGLSRAAASVSNSTNPAYGRQSSGSVSHPSGYTVTQSMHRRPPTFAEDGSLSLPPPDTSLHGPQGYPSNCDGFEADEDEFEDYPGSGSYPSSGRGTPVGTRRLHAQSLQPGREPIASYERRGVTEDKNGPLMTQWRNNGIPTSPHSTSTSSLRSNSSTLRPVTPRLTSNLTISQSSDPSASRRPTLRSQFSSTRLKGQYDGDDRSQTPPITAPANGISRSRSASQPSAYIPKTIPPPLPSSQWQPPSHSSASKRGSGSSDSTGGSSDYSPNSSSPITPFGSSESSIGGVGIRTSRSQTFENLPSGHPKPQERTVMVKVHFNEDIFVIQVSRATEFEDLVEKVGRKIRLCGPRRDDGPLRVKYKDEDGDLVSLGSTEDVQMAFEQFQPGGEVKLFVT